jgi:hypothetical protein
MRDERGHVVISVAQEMRLIPIASVDDQSST